MQMKEKASILSSSSLATCKIISNSRSQGKHKRSCHYSPPRIETSILMLFTKGTVIRARRVTDGISVKPQEAYLYMNTE